MLHKRTLERKLFGWLLLVTLVPALALLIAAAATGSRTLSLVGTLGPWTQIGASGRALTDAIEADAPDSLVAEAAARHRAQLSESVLQASRWTYLGERIAAAAPIAIAAIAVLLTILASLLARRLARQLARPIGELVSWTAALGDGRPLPPRDEAERDEPLELATLRAALRTAAVEIGESRARALESERTRAWGEMARRIAHEMKNPLTPLRLAAYRLQGSAAANGAIGEAVSIIRQETDRLDELARSFAMIGRPVTGPATDVDLEELMRALLESDVPDYVSTTVTTDGTPLVRGHYDALVRAFRNLVKNAVEAIGSGHATGQITIRIAGHAAAVEVAIADNGPGIPPDMEAVLFEPDRTSKAGGTGLGLAIVKQVIAAHGGAVVARSRAHRGAEFVVTLPRDGGRIGFDPAGARGVKQETA